MPNYQHFYKTLSTCPITKKTMQDPVIAPDGYCYERKALKGYLKQHKNITPKGFKVKSYERDHVISSFTALATLISDVGTGKKAHKEFYDALVYNDDDDAAGVKPDGSVPLLRQSEDDSAITAPVVFDGQVMSLSAARQIALIPGDLTNKVIIKYRQLADKLEYDCSWGDSYNAVDYWWTGIRLSKAKVQNELESEDNDKEKQDCGDYVVMFLTSCMFLLVTVGATFLYGWPALAIIKQPANESAMGEAFNNFMGTNLTPKVYDKHVNEYVSKILLGATFFGTCLALLWTNALNSIGSPTLYTDMCWSVGFAFVATVLVASCLLTYAARRECVTSTETPQLYTQSLPKPGLGSENTASENTPLAQAIPTPG